MAEQNHKQKGKTSLSRRCAEWIQDRFTIESPKSDQPSTHLAFRASHQQQRSRSPFRRKPKSSTPSTPSVTSLTPLAPSTSLISSAVLSLTQSDPNASTKCSSPWELGLAIAHKKLSEHGLPPLSNTSGQLASEIIESTVGSLQAIINDANQNQNIKKAAAGRRLRDILQTF